MNANLFMGRQGAWAFGLGCIMVTVGVLLHIPMFMMGKDMGFKLAGMAMDNGMLAGMFVIVAGIAVAGYGLLPKGVGEQSGVRNRPAD